MYSLYVFLTGRRDIDLRIRGRTVRRLPGVPLAMRRFVVVGLLALVAAPRGAVGRPPPPVLALEGGTLDRPSRLVALDPGTLETLRRGPALPGFAFGLAYARSPDGGTIALLPRPSDTADHLFLVDRGTLRVVRRVALGGTACALAWPDRSRVLALVADDACYRKPRLALVALDRRNGSVQPIDTAGLGPVLFPSATIAGGAAVLTAGVGLARLLALTGRGAERIELPWRPPAGRTLALAADPAGRRVFVVRGDWTVVDVSLTRRTVRTHRLSIACRKASATKGATGSVVSAAFVGDHSLAVAGGTVDPRTGAFTTRGAWFVDTVTWRVRSIDKDAGAVAAAPGLALVFAGPWDQVSNQSAGSGVSAFTSAGRLRYRALPDARIASVRVEGAYAYA